MTYNKNKKDSISHKRTYHQTASLAFPESTFTIKRRGTKATCSNSQLIICRRFFSDNRNSQKLSLAKKPNNSLRTVQEPLVHRKKKKKKESLNQGHGYPSQTCHPGMWTLLQSSPSKALTHRHRLKACQLYNDLKKKNVKKYRLLFVTDVCIPGYIFKTLC